MLTAIDFLRYQIKAGNAHGLHSPYVFKLFTDVIEPYKHYYAFDEIEALRTALLEDNTKLKVTDFGAGSKKLKSKERKVKDIAKNSLSSQKVGELLFKLVAYLKPKEVIELGTCLGISTLYLAKVSPDVHITTFEGCPIQMDVAESIFKSTGADNITTIQGNLDETLGPFLSQKNKVDFVYFDANHRYEPTVRYFETFLPYKHEETVFVFDDIHWSNGMRKAWEKIKCHPEVKITIDLFQVGLVLFRDKQPKQDFTLLF
ncbi:class I SAM-dependent methyltransferase [Limibacter armeniacum]|uniref:O-methyltransferase n=1 Tax=Limibacter armeniacum TaxID=466084 RepID=UPI002FE64700